MINKISRFVETLHKVALNILMLFYCWEYIVIKYHISLVSVFVLQLNKSNICHGNKISPRQNSQTNPGEQTRVINP